MSFNLMLLGQFPLSPMLDPFIDFHYVQLLFLQTFKVDSENKRVLIFGTSGIAAHIPKEEF
jgi:hypothetical protein